MRSGAFKVKCKWMICDGDSTAYNEIWDIYGACSDCQKYMFMSKEETAKVKDSLEYALWQNKHENNAANCNRVCKLDCIGHVQKRMGKHLLNWKQKHGIRQWTKDKCESETVSATTNVKTKSTKKKESKQSKAVKSVKKDCKKSHTHWSASRKFNNIMARLYVAIAFLTIQRKMKSTKPSVRCKILCWQFSGTAVCWKMMMKDTSTVQIHQNLTTGVRVKMENQ